MQRNGCVCLYLSVKYYLIIGKYDIGISSHILMIKIADIWRILLDEDETGCMLN